MTDEELFLKFVDQVGLKVEEYSNVDSTLTKVTFTSTTIAYTFWQHDFGNRTFDFNFDKDGKYIDFLIEGGDEN